jgi:hypothetical protein
MQLPPEQTWPVAQAGPVPHLHTPPAQALALVASQVRQAEPAIPQLVTEGAEVHTPPAQQPLAQFPELQVPPVQAPPLQVCPGPQAGPAPQSQAPAAEQLSARATLQLMQVAPLAPQEPGARVWQTEPLQHPAGHEVSSQTHRPLTQRWPPPQGPPVVPHTHAPAAEQVSAVTVLHEAHAAPVAPQVSKERLTQVLF